MSDKLPLEVIQLAAQLLPELKSLIEEHGKNAAAEGRKVFKSYKQQIARDRAANDAAVQAQIKAAKGKKS